MFHMAKEKKSSVRTDTSTHEFVTSKLEEISDDVEIIDLSDMTPEEAAETLGGNEESSRKKHKKEKKKEKKEKKSAKDDIDIKESKENDVETEDAEQPNGDALTVGQTQKIERELAEIYENADGSLPDMQTFEKRKGGRFLRAFITVVLSLGFLGGAIWYGYTQLYHRDGAFVEDDVILSIGGEDMVAYGEEVRYRVRFKNAQGVPLDNSVLELRYPAGFVFESASKAPDADTNNMWTLGPLQEGDGEYIDISGKLYGDLNERQSFRVFLNYTPSNFSSTFQKVATQETSIAGAPLTVALIGPKQVAQGVATTFTIDVSPEKEAVGTLPPHLALVFDSEAPFVTQDMKPKEGATLTDRTWILDPTTHASTTTIYTITGAFAGGEETLIARAHLIGWQEGESIAEAHILASAEQEIAIEDQQLSVSLVANGSQQDITVQPGEHLNATIVVKNNTEEPLKNVRVRLMFDAPSVNGRSIMDWPSLEDEADGNIVGEQLSDTIRRGQITWSSAQIGDLRQLDPGEQLTIDVTIPIRSGEDVDLTAYESYVISLTGNAQYTLSDSEETAAGVPIVLTINSDTTFEVRDEADDDVHTFTWLLGNTFHPLKDIEAQVDFYGDVSFSQDDAVVPAGELTYDEKEKKLVWHIDEMPLSVDVLALQFPLTLNKANPSQTQLTSKVRVTAIDQVTGKQILLIGDEVGL